MSIILKQVSLLYNQGSKDEHFALSDINLQVTEGEFIGIMGRTGCGKSSLIQLISGLIEPTGGQIFLYGQDICKKDYDRTILRQNIGVIFQYPECQLFESTVEREIAFGLKHMSLSKEETINCIQEALSFVGFSYDKIRKESPHALSGGEKRRLAIAGVLARKPKILILDEPIAGLDPKSRVAFLDLLRKLNRNGVTILMISHNIDVLCEYATRIWVMNHGHVVMDDIPQKIFRDTTYIKQLNLDVSTPRQMIELLQEKGIELPKDVVTYEAFLAALKQQFGKNGGDYL
ncbi:ATP-binding cassette domain-containing protein [Lachnospiraceae bacterium OttesenSCG-928-D06]|nr:ATP-binding cassette domain-containing protein [Lachnospiraceae bacterium OttesenSCG-928-D06]